MAPLDKLFIRIYTVSQKILTPLLFALGYNFLDPKPIMTIFGTDVAERVCCRRMSVMQPHLSNVSALRGQTNPGNCAFSLKRWFLLCEKNTKTHSNCRLVTVEPSCIITETS